MLLLKTEIYCTLVSIVSFKSKPSRACLLAFLAFILLTFLYYEQTAAKYTTYISHGAFVNVYIDALNNVSFCENNDYYRQEYIN